MTYVAETSSKVAVYLRVSTLDQAKGIASQEAALRDYLANHGIKAAAWYRDTVSGSTVKRPGFDRLRRDIFGGKVKTVVCWKLDRLSRSLRDGINTLGDWLEKGVSVVAVAQQLDFSGPTGQLVASVLFALAALERENIRENTKRGLAAARAHGVRLGRPAKLDDKSIKKQRASGMSVGELAASLSVSRQAIYQSLRRAGAAHGRKSQQDQAGCENS